LVNDETVAYGVHKASDEDDGPPQRRAEVGEQADYHVAAQRRQREREAVQAQALIDAFIERARGSGLPPEELTARPWSGNAKYRTGVMGWFLRRDKSIGIDTEGRFYVLVVPPQRFGRWRTVSIEPTAPLLQPGRGAGDGETASLETLLQLRLSW
jgi:hypothetical protein